jgi:uncharacterized protein YjbI with pentapeptide repeats
MEMKCVYQGERIIEIEKERAKDDKDKISYIEDIIRNKLGDKANCRFDAINEKGFCIFHDPDYWREHADEIKNEFLKELKKGENFFVGYHLPTIAFPKDIKIEQDLHMEFTKIHGELDVSEIRFDRNVSFDGAEFDKASSFVRAEFYGDVSFYGARFNGDVSFYGAEFYGDVSFYGARFNGNVQFHKAIFMRSGQSENRRTEVRVSFYGANFRGDVSFDEAKFNEASSFVRAEFYGDVSFYGAEFNKRATFDDSFFSKGVSFRDVKFPKAASNLKDKDTDYISFRRVNFKISTKIVFDNCNMERVSFIHTNISRITFRNIKWGKDFRIFDEELLLLKLNNDDLTYKDLTYDNVLTVYRNLRDNYDNNMRYEESGKFFINEMKLKRITMKLSIEKFVMFVYEKLALYGESYVRPLLAIIAIMMISFIIRLYIINQFNLDTIVDELIKSTDIFFTNRVDIDNITVIERLTSIPLFGMLIVALRRKLERRVRR